MFIWDFALITLCLRGREFSQVEGDKPQTRQPLYNLPALKFRAYTSALETWSIDCNAHRRI